MNRSLAALAAASMIVASVPSLGFAEETTTTATDSVSSTSTSTGNDWKRPCENLTGLLKAQCIVKNNPGRGAKKDRVERRNDNKVLRLTSECKDKEGQEQIKCMRQKRIKHEVRPAVKRVIKRTIRGKTVESSTSSASN